MSRSACAPLRRQAQADMCPEMLSDFEYPIGLRWSCIRCTASCRDVPYHKRNILLTKRDVDRIMKVTGQDQSKFSMLVANMSPYERRMKMTRGRCVFLEGLGCSIYHVRPLICKLYPFSLTPSERGGFSMTFDPGCSGIGKGAERKRGFFMSLACHAIRELRLTQEQG